MHRKIKPIIKGEQLLFTVSLKQKLLLWFVVLISVATAVFTTVMVFSMTEESLHKEYNSMASARTWQIIMLILGNVFLAVMVWMSGRYVFSITKQDDAYLTVVVWHLLLFQRKKTIPLTAFKKTIEYHEGKANYPGVPNVHAPWIGMKPLGYKKMIIDLQGEFPHGVNTLVELIDAK